MEALIVGIVGVIGALVVQVAVFRANRKIGLTEAQIAYRETLEAMNKALTSRITDLENTVSALANKNEALEAKVTDLSREVRELTLENLELLRRLVERGETRNKRSTDRKEVVG